MYHKFVSSVSLVAATHHPILPFSFSFSLLSVSFTRRSGIKARKKFIFFAYEATRTSTRYELKQVSCAFFPEPRQNPTRSCSTDLLFLYNLPPGGEENA